MRGRILAIGGAHLDRRGRISGATLAGASNPGVWREEAGGGVFNAARTLARLGHGVRMVSPRGGDAAGERVGEAAAEAGIEDTPLTFLDRRTASYTAILTRQGDLVIALADMAIYELYGPRQIARRGIRDAIAATDAVLTDANLPAATLEALGAACRSAGKPLFGIAISPAKVERFRPVLGQLAALFMNAAEAASLGECDIEAWRTFPDRLRAAGLGAGVVTRGAAPMAAFSGAQSYQLAPPPVADIRDVTGAGDALAAGFIHALLAGHDVATALRHGVAAASVCLQSQCAVAQDMDAARLDAALSLVPEARPLA